jgi:transcriptional regulator of acetoin/glycerol metabolism
MEFGSIPETGMDGRVARSWNRSLAAGLLPDSRMQMADHTGGAALREIVLRNHELLAHSRPVMEYLFDQVRHNQNVVVLADHRGTLMHTLGDAIFLDKAQRVALTAGACWHESQRGTNAIGTAIAEGTGIEIHGADGHTGHFRRPTQRASPHAGPGEHSCPDDREPVNGG